MEEEIIRRFRAAGVFGESGNDFSFTKAIKAIKDFYVFFDGRYDIATQTKREDIFRQKIRGL